MKEKGKKLFGKAPIVGDVLDKLDHQVEQAEKGSVMEEHSKEEIKPQDLEININEEKDLTEVYKIFEQANNSIKDVTDIVKENIDIRRNLKQRDETLKKNEEDQAKKFAKELEQIDAKKAELKKEREKLEDDKKELQAKENQLQKAKDDLNIHIEELKKERELYEKDKQELARNLIKFNQLVSNFYEGVDKCNEQNEESKV